MQGQQEKSNQRYGRASMCFGYLCLGILSANIWFEIRREKIDTEALNIGIEEVRGKYRNLGDYAFLLHSIANSLESCDDKGGCAANERETLEEALKEIDRDKVIELLHRNPKRDKRP
jgi:hypothetical protein